MSKLPQFVISVFAGLLVLAFQNCSPTDIDSKKNSAMPKSGEGKIEWDKSSPRVANGK